MPPVRVRFAPSPTGFFHIGSARTALFNWLYARHTGGTFILRIEDTDQARNSEAFLKLIYDSLTWLGMDWDEGPNPNGVGERGSYGPYRQSQRGAIYQKYKQQLLDSGRAYEKDGAVWFRLLGERYKVFDDHRKKEVEKVKTAPVIIDDRIRGRVERQEDEDFVIFRSDGNPVFHFVNVVDDIEMKVSHIIRGEDHLSNTSKHVRLYEGFGVAAPAFAHIPLILKSPEMGQGKMSKRDKGALIEEYQQRHFLPEALVNYLALLGWNPGDDREKMPVEEIIKLFDLPAVNQSNAKFDGKKLANMNMQYLHEVSDDSYVQRAENYLRSVGAMPHVDPQKFRTRILLTKGKIKALEELTGYTQGVWQIQFDVPDKAQANVVKYHPEQKIPQLYQVFEGLPNDFLWIASNIEQKVNDLAATNGVKPAEYIHTGRVAVSGSNVGPSFYHLLEAFGRQETQQRLNYYIHESGKFQQ